MIPFSWFRDAGAQKPSGNNFAVIDFGQTIKVDDFEISSDAILYEHDDAYRKRAKARLLEHDDSLGGAIKRLRLQKGLTQKDFPGVTAKEIRRIERNEVRRPHGYTIEQIAKTLGVDVTDLTTY